MQDSFRVFICEPSEIVSLGISHALQRCDKLTVTGTATTLAQTIELLDAEPADAIVVDPALTDANGFEALESLARRYPNTRLLVLSNRLDEDFVFGAFIAGANGYCVKNVFSTYLISAAYSVAAGAAWLDNQVAQFLLPRADRPAKARNLQQQKLSDRELEVLKLIKQGLSNKEIAAKLQLSPATIKTYLRTMFRKLGVKDRIEAASRAAREGLLG